MGDLVPAPSTAEVELVALAKAAARLALAEREKAPCDCLDEDAVEAITRKSVTEAFRQFGVDLSDTKSVKEFRATLDHAERSRQWWDKASTTIWNGFWAAIGAGVLAAVAKFGFLGSVK